MIRAIYDFVQLFLSVASDAGIWDDFWLYGTDNGCSPGNMHWCSNFKQLQPKEVTWAAGEPSNKGRCVYLKSSNSSSLATEDCSKEMRFLCDVRKKGTDGMAMQRECLETWDVTAGERDESLICSYTFNHYVFLIRGKKWNSIR
jgi:hypothetical protein